ncbi:MAG: hypothetical protein Ctma_0446 [Catillopecten margaritatus gill symbiont]|uniref:Uncharacterized protein n=1 Tax=Catillopecten margaritatus gill symbiont TaxID=3083288 RepID=A0AAU6PFG4_9GAMM
MSKYSVEQFIELIEMLPADKEVPVGTQGYNRYRTQKAHWLGWLDSKSTAGTYQRQDAPNRGAKYVYNHIMEPKMLLWLISALGLQSELVERAKEEVKNKKSMAGSCAAIRKMVPWQTLEKILLKDKH